MSAAVQTAPDTSAATSSEGAAVMVPDKPRRSWKECVAASNAMHTTVEVVERRFGSEAAFTIAADLGLPYRGVVPPRRGPR